MAQSGGTIDIWGDGKQTRSFLYIDECVEGATRLLRSDFTGPVNIGSEEMVTINQLVDIIADRRRADRETAHRRPAGRARAQLRQPAEPREARLVAEPELARGVGKTYAWIERQVRRYAG
jgi:GDP-D-mannose 3',5'-epimerase